MLDLVKKYNIPTPRYTSYPTVPYWENNLNEENWKIKIKQAFKLFNKEGISIYIHLPFCESLCTYCACNTRITVNHAVETKYIQALLKEWKLYLNEFEGKPLIKELHLGGGTPTFFSPENLKYLISSLLANAELAEEFDFSFEGHPDNTSFEHLKTLFELGFKRLSLGIQDFDIKVQSAINRFQKFETVENLIHTAREIGYTSINLDIIYGLPFQTEMSIFDTFSKVKLLMPDRIAFYSYAHVPWLKPGQRKYSELDLPADENKKKLYKIGMEILNDAGYKDIGFDHFALPNDALYIASESKTLHRNFMGYTTNKTKMLIGLGCSSISDLWVAFGQNIKTVEEYQDSVNAGKFAISKGHILNTEDLTIRQHILNLMCLQQTNIDNYFYEAEERLSELFDDKLIEIIDESILVNNTGKLFLRNICLAYDLRYWKKLPQKAVFSSSS
jgi:oxygen-independent coproporphyrinogen III oxidase